MKDTRSLRLVFFGIGIIAVVALTGMNVYSLYELRESTIETAKDHKKNQLEEFTSQVRYRFFQPFRGIRKLDINYLQNYYHTYEKFPESFNKVLLEASQDSIFSDIYFTPNELDHCLDSSDPIFKFNPEIREFVSLNEVSELVCDGVGLARSRMKVLIDDYRWNNKTTFDTHRSMTLSMINLTKREIIGHLTFTINKNYLVDDFIARNLVSKFGPGNETGIIVWLRDFMQEEILSSSDPAIEYSRDFQIDIRQRFPELLDNWVLHAKIIESPTIAASNASLTRNLIVLVTAVMALFGALLFMFITAKRERELAQRQAGFLANVTHEFKTPLATIQAAGENLSDGRVTDPFRIKSYGDHIYNETIRLRKMIEKLLDIAKIDSEQSTVQTAVRKPGMLLQSYYNLYSGYIESEGFTIEYAVEPDLPDIVIDPDHFNTIINNLVDNAVKYSFEKKQITLRAEKRGDCIAFIVKDRGIGIPENEQQKIFEKFYRIEDSMTAKTKGHGLGLSIVKNLVELNGGKIELNSTPDAGTIFIVKFPVPDRNGKYSRSARINDDQQLKNELKNADYADK